MRDYANILQLVILSNLENLNSEMIAQGIEQKTRLERLNEIAKKQYNILQDSKGIKKLEGLDKIVNSKTRFEKIKTGYLRYLIVFQH